MGIYLKKSVRNFYPQILII